MRMLTTTTMKLMMLLIIIIPLSAYGATVALPPSLAGILSAAPIAAAFPVSGRLPRRFESDDGIGAGNALRSSRPLSSLYVADGLAERRPVGLPSRRVYDSKRGDAFQRPTGACSGATCALFLFFHFHF